MVAFGILLASTVDEEEAEKKKQKFGFLCKANKLHVNHFVYNKSPQNCHRINFLPAMI